jgi:hypothetical protein
MTTNSAGYAGDSPETRPESIDEQVQRKGIRPVESVEDMAQDGVFESDEELDQFLAHVYAARHADLALPGRCATSSLTRTWRPGDQGQARRPAGREIDRHGMVRDVRDRRRTVALGGHADLGNTHP